MKGLLVKDFRFLWGQKGSLVIFIALGFYFLLTGTDPSFGLVYTMMLAGLFSTSSITYDSHEKGMSFLLTLPIQKKTYVISKYVFALLVMVIMGASITLLGFGFNMLSENPVDMSTLGDGFVMAIAFGLVMVSFMIPIYVIFGAEKARIAVMVIIGIAVAGYFVITKLLGDSMAKAADLLTKLEGLSDLQAALLVAGIMLVILVISMIITIVGLEKKEY
jgi:hypothetical protein